MCLNKYHNMQLVLARRDEIVAFVVATIVMYWCAKAITSWLFPLGTPLYGGVPSPVPEASKSISEFLWRIWASCPRWEILFHLLWLVNVICTLGLLLKIHAFVEHTFARVELLISQKQSV